MFETLKRILPLVNLLMVIILVVAVITLLNKDSKFDKALPIIEGLEAHALRQDTTMYNLILELNVFKNSINRTDDYLFLLVKNAEGSKFEEIKDKAGKELSSIYNENAKE